jgi:dTDP-4-amino-4,6-dideoxygalactose transaminase
MLKVPFVDLAAQYRTIKKDIDSAIDSVVAETAFIGGKYVQSFESSFSALLGVNYVVSCANGTDSLYIIMKVLGIGPGDEVITVANSWISSSETISQVGARPVFVDIDPDYYSMNEELIESRITNSTRAIIAVNLQGQMCAIDRIKAVCDNYKLFLIEDCAQSHLSALNGCYAGLTGIASSFSFYPGKNLGAYGDAGCIVTNDLELANRFRMFANHGALKKHHHLMEGINSRMDGLQAAILSAKLPHLKSWTEARIHHAARYDQYLAGIEQIQLPKVRPDSVHSFHLYTIRAERRTQLMEYLKALGIDTAIHYPTALPNLPAYQYLGHVPSDFPEATKAQDQILSLPMYAELTDEQIHFVCDSIKRFYNEDNSPL